MQVVDLLLTMAKAALNSVRGEMIFDPFPNIVDPNDSQKLALSEKVSTFHVHVCRYTCKAH